MTRIKGLTKEQASDDMKVMFEEQEKRYGFSLNNAPIYALRPTIRKGIQALADGIEQSGLIEPALRHLLCLKSAAINGCPY
jgi:hypothetical protein